MAGALRKLRQLEEQVKLIPVLQVKLSVLQEEKRQLTTRSVGTWVRERDLGMPDGEAALAAKVAVLETQLKKALQELQAAQARQADLQPQAWPPPDSPVRVDTVRVVEGPREVEVAASTAAGAPAQRAQSLEPYGAGLRALATSGGAESPPVFRSHEVVETVFPTPPASTSNVHLVKKISITERSCDGAAGPPQAPAESSLSPPESEGDSPAQPEKNTGLRKEEPADPESHQRSLQFVGVNGRYESSSEDSSTAENFSDNESTENEAPEPEERVPSVVEAPQLRPKETAKAKTSREECQLSRESQQAPTAEGASGSSAEEEIRMELSPDLISACLALEKYLENPSALTERELEWLRLACRSDAHPELVRRHLVTFRAMSARLLDYVVNIADSNGNTALHYSAGQTALMLAVSHGRVDVVKALLACEADVNVQDDDGSTALMCACEHGHKEITALLLAVPSCDISITDRAQSGEGGNMAQGVSIATDALQDGSTALMVALDAG
ncbi:hypothetical protein E2I00_011953, partial [Balaenoptera physalus]